MTTIRAATAAESTPRVVPASPEVEAAVRDWLAVRGMDPYTPEGMGRVRAARGRLEEVLGREPMAWHVVGDWKWRWMKVSGCGLEVVCRPVERIQQMKGTRQ